MPIRFTNADFLRAEGVGISRLTAAVPLSHFLPQKPLGNMGEGLRIPHGSVPRFLPSAFRGLKRRVWDSNPRTIFKTVTG